MKTNKFENTIRQKLESIEPDFQEQDWAKMQSYMQAHTPPTFWQQHSSWIGYAAAASITTVMAFLYVNQLSKNNDLTADVKNLKNQIEVIRNSAAPAVKADTIYIVQKESADPNKESHVSKSYDQYPAAKQNPSGYNAAYEHSETAYQPAQKLHNAVRDNNALENVFVAKNKSDLANTNNLTDNKSVNAASQSNQKFLVQSVTGNNDNAGFSGSQKILGSGFNLNPIEVTALRNDENPAWRKMHYNLANRISARQVSKNLPAASAPNPKAAALARNVEKTNKAENVIPELNLSVPYRFGGSIQAESNGVSKTILGEVLVFKKFSVSAGISWLKVKPMEFFTEKMFRDKNRKDFKRSHPNEVPLALEVFNIKVSPTLVQIPLTVAFRNSAKNDWSYYGSAGTNIRVSSKESISYACRAPNNEYISQSFDRKTNLPAVSSMNLSLGIEKVWHPIVVQAEGYLYTYFKPLTPLSHSSGPGVKVKLMYQIGGKM